MNTTRTNENAFATAEDRAVDFTATEIALNKAIDRAVAWFDKWIFTPLLGKGQEAID